MLRLSLFISFVLLCLVSCQSEKGKIDAILSDVFTTLKSEYLSNLVESEVKMIGVFNTSIPFEDELLIFSNFNRIVAKDYLALEKKHISKLAMSQSLEEIEHVDFSNLDEIKKDYSK